MNPNHYPKPLQIIGVLKQALVCNYYYLLTSRPFFQQSRMHIHFLDSRKRLNNRLFAWNYVFHEFKMCYKFKKKKNFAKRKNRLKSVATMSANGSAGNGVGRSALARATVEEFKKIVF